MSAAGPQHHPRNLAMAQLALSEGVPRNLVEACLQLATQRGLGFSEVGVSEGLLTAEQGRYLFERTQAPPRPLSAPSSGAITVVRQPGLGAPSGGIPSISHPGLNPASISHPGLAHPGQSHPGTSGELDPTIRGGGLMAGSQGGEALTMRGDFRGEMAPTLRGGMGAGFVAPPGPASQPGLSHPSGAVPAGFDAEGQTIDMGVRRDASGAFVHAPGSPPAGLSRPSSSYLRPSLQGAPSSYGGTSAGGVISSFPTEAIFEGERYEVSKELSPNSRLVKDTRIGRIVVLFEREMSLPPASRQEFLRGPRMMAQLDHPAVPQVHDIGAEGERPFYSQERIAGVRLTRVDVAEDERFESAPQVLRRFLQIAGAVAQAHERGLLHSRIAAERILVGKQGQVWLTGWQDARALSHASPAVQRAAAGAPPGLRANEDSSQLAPELRLGMELDERADVWGLGSVLFTMLTGEVIDAGEAEAQLDKATVRGRRLPRELGAVLGKALAFDARHRYGSARELALDLRRYLDGERVEAAGDSALFALLRFVSRYKAQSAMAGAAAAALLISALAFAWEIRANIAEAATARAEATEASERAQVVLAASEKALASSEAPRFLVTRRLDTERLLLELLRATAFLGPRDDIAPLRGGFEDAKAAGAEVDKRAVALPTEERSALGVTATSERRARRVFADWALRRIPNPDPALAAEEYRRVRVQDNGGAEDALGEFFALRRLASKDEEAASLLSQAQSRYSGSFEAQVFSVEERLRRAEALLEQARQDILDGPKALQLVESAQEICGEALVNDLAALKGLRPASAYVFELHGRREAVMMGVRLGSIKIGKTRAPYGTIKAMSTAIALDPTTPDPGVALARRWNEGFGLHQSWRWVNGWSLGRVLRRKRYISRPEPLYEVQELMEQLDNEAGAIAISDLILERALQPPLSPATLRRPIVQEILLSRQGLRLSVGLAPEPLPDDLILESGFEAERELLRAYEELIAGRLQPAADALGACFQGRGRATLSSNQRIERLLPKMFRDPRLRREDVVGLLEQVAPLQSRPDLLPWKIIGARVDIVSRLGYDPRQEFQVFQSWAQAMAQQSGSLAQVIYGSLDWGLAQMAFLRFLGRLQPEQAAVHVDALRTWGSFNGFNNQEELAVAASEVIAERLEALGRTELARGFRAMDPVGELWVRRYWVPPELHGWPNGAGGLSGVAEESGP